MAKTTAYLSDGRHVEVPENFVADWKYQVDNDDTTSGLGDWYTDFGEERLDEILGKKHDGVRCEHTPLSIRVTNSSQTEGWNPDKSHVSSLICNKRECVLDAMAWVERSTGETAVFIASPSNDSDTWSKLVKTPYLVTPQTDTAPVSITEPLSEQEAKEIIANNGEEGYISCIVSVPFMEFLAAASSNDPDNWDEHDYLHSKAFSFGLSYGSEWEALSLQDQNLTLRYSTDISEFLDEKV